MNNNQSFQYTNNRVIIDNIVYSINEDDNTSGVIRNDSFQNDIFIPYSIFNKENEFIITKILSGAFKYSRKLKSMSFASNSKLQTIEKYSFFNSSIEYIKIPHHLTTICESAFSFCVELKIIDISANSKLQTIETNAFFNSSIEQILIPSSLIELKEGWCNQTSKLNKIIVDQNNHLFSSYEDKFIIGKSSISNKNYDVLVFSVRDIKVAKIPNFIEKIGPYSFNKCSHLHEISVSNDSKLRRIEKDAFSHSSIKNISIQSHVNYIGERAFYSCKQIHNFTIPMNSNLKIIDKEAFAYSSISSLYIPFSVNLIDNNAFNFCGNLKIIEIDANSELKRIKKNIFEGCINVIIMISVNMNDVIRT